MESDPAGDAASALRAAEESRDRLARTFVLPRYFLASIGAAITAQIVTTALGLAVDEAWARVSLVVGVVVFTLVALTQLLRFRRANGAWLGGLASRVVFGGATTASAVYPLALGGAVWAAFVDAWWLMALCGVSGGVGYAMSGMRWMHAYRDDPAGRSRGESMLLLVALAVPAVGGLVLLVALR